MPGSSFGLAFRVTTFGESHGPALGVVIDGVPVVTVPPVLSSEKVPERMRTSSASRRCVVKRDWPGLRRSSSDWISAA